MAGLWALGLTIVHPLDQPEDQGPGPSCPWRWRVPSEGGREGMAPDVSQRGGGRAPSLGVQHSTRWLILCHPSGPPMVLAFPLMLYITSP